MLGSNQRRLSRRFYRPLPLATRATCLVPSLDSTEKDSGHHDAARHQPSATIGAPASGTSPAVAPGPAPARTADWPSPTALSRPICLSSNISPGSHPAGADLMSMNVVSVHTDVCGCNSHVVAPGAGCGLGAEGHPQATPHPVAPGARPAVTPEARPAATQKPRPAATPGARLVADWRAGGRYRAAASAPWNPPCTAQPGPGCPQCAPLRSSLRTRRFTGGNPRWR